MADSDPGFVLDEASGLYCHAGSGFYHDPDAGWYYNTHDGVYYTFEDGTYVPVSSTDDSRGVILEPQDSSLKEGSPFLNSDLKEHMLPITPETGTLDIHEGQSGRELTVDAGEGVQNSDEREGAQVDHDVRVEVEHEYPLWYFDTVRSVYWYYDKESCAYYLYQGADNNSAEEVGADEIAGIREDDTGREGPATYVSNSEGQEKLNTEESSPQQENGETFQPTSGWVEEALIELYLKGYPQESLSTDEGPWITSADIFNESPKDGSYHARSGFSIKSSYLNGANTPGSDDQMWSACRYRNTTQEFQVLSNDSDNDGSEELEEGEWVPDEPLRIVDGEEGEVCSFDGKGREEEDNRFSSQSYVASDEYLQSRGEFQDFYHENGEALKRTETDDVDMEEGEISIVDEQQQEEEQWRAQYGQVVREKTRDYLIPGVVDLWDWTIIDKESTTSKQGKLKKQLVGRIVSSVTRLHPSLSGTSGLIRTSAIKAAELDFVKVSSGKVYRLRRPSRKHLAAVGSYDSSNPTKDLGLPAIGLAALDTTEEKETTDGSVAIDQTKGRADSFSKPFIPNTGHWRFQRLLSTKKGRGVPAALMASRYLSPEEMLINEQRKQRYRDRAAERRNLHGGFGVGPGQKGLSVVEQEKLEADEAVGMAGALEKAAAAPALGRENVGKRMLEGMGWKEGQTLGVEGGLVKPLQAQGNVGRAGLGWAV